MIKLILKIEELNKNEIKSVKKIIILKNKVMINNNNKYKQ